MNYSNMPIQPMQSNNKISNTAHQQLRNENAMLNSPNKKIATPMVDGMGQHSSFYQKPPLNPINSNGNFQ